MRLSGIRKNLFCLSRPAAEALGCKTFICPGIAPFVRRKLLRMETCPVDGHLTGQNAGVNVFVRGNGLWVDEMIFD